MLEQAMGLGEIHPGLTIGRLPLVVAREAPTMAQPAEGALDDPAAGLHDEAWRLPDLADYRDSDAKGGFGLGTQVTPLVLIAPDQHQPRIAGGIDRQQQHGAIAIRDVS